MGNITFWHITGGVLAKSLTLPNLFTLFILGWMITQGVSLLHHAHDGKLRNFSWRSSSLQFVIVTIILTVIYLTIEAVRTYMAWHAIWIPAEIGISTVIVAALVFFGLHVILGPNLCFFVFMRFCAVPLILCSLLSVAIGGYAFDHLHEIALAIKP